MAPVALFRILTYVVKQDGAFRVSATSSRSDVEHSTPLADVETGEAPTKADALTMRAALVEKVSAKVRARGDTVVQIREIGDIDKLK
jgi:hypothetical protein